MEEELSYKIRFDDKFRKNNLFSPRLFLQFPPFFPLSLPFPRRYINPSLCAPLPGRYSLPKSKSVPFLPPPVSALLALKETGSQRPGRWGLKGKMYGVFDSLSNFGLNGERNAKKKAGVRTTKARLEDQ